MFSLEEFLSILDKTVNVFMSINVYVVMNLTDMFM